MITRLLYLAFIWFLLSLVALLACGRRLRSGDPALPAVWLAILLLLGDVWALFTFATLPETALLTGVAFALGLVCMRWLRDWNAPGQAVWTTYLLAAALFTIYAFQVTAFSPLNAVSFILALIFFFVELLGLLITLTSTYESLDAMCRIRWRRQIDLPQPVPGYLPMVSLHVPAYNEPPEVVEKTLRSLAALDYPNYEVLVVDNNTPNEGSWRRLEAVCTQLGPRFRFMHLGHWPGYKSGALNFALAQTDPQAEIIGSIDADYQLDPAFLRDLTPAFADPRVAFLQTPQNYRDFSGSPYLEPTYHSYRYFFSVSMPVRNEFNAIIFAGTMGLIRKSALQQIGGWDEWCITEDSEASLRILKQGYQSLYINRPYGTGLIPFTFEGLKRQRFRWCFGGIQILKKHWDSLMPWSHWVYPSNRLTLAQRYFYLSGGLQWFTDLLNLIFSVFLVIGGLFSLFGGQHTIRPLTNALMVLPALFLAMGLWRFVWVLRSKLALSWRLALKTMYNFFSLGWAVTLACILGLVQREGVFLRTPKSKSNSRAMRALAVTRWETMIGLTCAGVGLLAFVARPDVRTLFLGGLLAWQSSLYLSAPYFSLLSAYDTLAQPRPQRGRPVLESRAARLALAFVLLLVLGVSLAQLLPPPAGLPAYIRFLPIEIPLRELFQVR